MTYKNFNRAILLRLIVIIILSMAVAHFLFVKVDYLYVILTSLLLLYAIYNIFRYFNKINQWIAFFLLGLENEDARLKAPSRSGNKAIDDIYAGINRLNDLFHQTKASINSKEEYFKTVLNKSSTGLFSINEKGRVNNINPAATKLTGLQENYHVNILSEINEVLPRYLIQNNEQRKSKSAIFENKFGQKLLFSLSEIKSQGELIQLVAVSDITKELDNGEVEAWIKLARTLSHEIMNNIAPITTISQVISSYYTKEGETIDAGEVDQNTVFNTVKGLKVIEERSVGLMSFVENYRKFTKIPAPKYTETDLCEIIENNILAASAYCGFDKIKLEKRLPSECLVSTDEKLLSQVIINLLKNACEALQSTNQTAPTLGIEITDSLNDIQLKISNNGPYIPAEIREQIFVPFYTTKEDGSGIGLSLSKQIMLKMDGDITLNTVDGGLTTFTVILNRP
jgi:nitrogen fixation/metabolism regulation signal transduction histidine kinase